MNETQAQTRLEQIRQNILAESVSTSEIVELESLKEFIRPGDTFLAEWAGIPEEEFCK